MRTRARVGFDLRVRFRLLACASARAAAFAFLLSGIMIGKATRRHGSARAPESPHYSPQPEFDLARRLFAEGPVKKPLLLRS